MHPVTAARQVDEQHRKDLEPVIAWLDDKDGQSVSVDWCEGFLFISGTLEAPEEGFGFYRIGAFFIDFRKHRPSRVEITERRLRLSWGSFEMKFETAPFREVRDIRR